MTAQAGRARKFVTRCLAVATMVALYFVAVLATSGLVMTTTLASAQAQRGRGHGHRGHGHRGHGFRGHGFRGHGFRGHGFRGHGHHGHGFRGGRGFGRGFGRGRGRGFLRGGVWFPWIGPGICHHPWTSARVFCAI